MNIFKIYFWESNMLNIAFLLLTIRALESKVVSKLSRSLNNPYHPEDDLITADIDSDNQKYDSESDISAVKIMQTNSRLKINGKYFETDKIKQ
ncbi:hypothetical protein KGM_213869 [Danaus plexippus plexippus]|uniref:Uncharacterized protein n=1 Tax=Danaus plexippus plexippus TaxID=278856 RepID=A0A212F530_DANPL|nr:hypothetical protein KGM_213869 [Danaus plexippus plexippus]